MAKTETQQRRRSVEAMATPRSIFLPQTETLGGYIFMGNDLTLREYLRRQIFGLPDYYRDSVRAIRPGTPLFLYNYSTDRLHGVFEATSFGGYNIDPSAWPDINYPHRSFFPAQVRIQWRRECIPLPSRISSRLLETLSVGAGRFRVELRAIEAQGIIGVFLSSEAQRQRQR